VFTTFECAGARVLFLEHFRCAVDAAGKAGLCKRPALGQCSAERDGVVVRVDFECDDELIRLLQAAVNPVPAPGGGTVGGDGFEGVGPLVGVRYVDA
jgi:hypothetical protein